MNRVTLGRTGLSVNRNGFGALPIQRVSMEEAKTLLRRAYDGGIDFYDTARAYSDSEEKLGNALHDVRDKIVLATKSLSPTADGIRADLEQSLRSLRTDYVDIFQLHNPAKIPRPGDGSGIYEMLEEQKKAGKLRFISLSNHRLAVAKEAVESGLYDTLQFPFSYLAAPEEVELVKDCAAHGVGFIAMKALGGGLITNGSAAFAYLAQFDNVLPIWGIQRMSELEEFLSCQAAPPALAGDIAALIEADRRALTGSFCRGCGYCLPCPAGIEINNCARMSLLLRRAPSAAWLSPHWQENMAKIKSCVQCGHCKAHCPYGLDTPALLLENLKDYEEILAGKSI